MRRVRARRLQRRLAAPRLIKAFAEANPSAFFVEIGSNDGEQHDHLRPFILKHQWQGIMVEPVPYVFGRLSENYGDIDRVALENAAVGPRDGKQPFYYLIDASEEERASLPDWYDGIGSFSKEAVLSHATHIPDIERRLVTAEVPTFTLDSLCSRHGVERLDLLLIDTEGFDWEIIRAVDFARWRPQLLIYEHYHLNPDERADAAAHLRAQGYETLEEGFDTFCLESRVNGSLRSAWNGLTPGVAGISKHDERR